MKKTIMSMIVFALLLSACADREPTAATEMATAVLPTTEPASPAATEEPTAEPSADPTDAPTIEPETETTANESSASGLPPAEIANDEGGPAVVTGEWHYTSAFIEQVLLEPVVMLLNMSRQIQGNYTDYVPRSGQIMGILTQPVSPAPTAYMVNVPVQPDDLSADVDNNGKQDTGVQIYATMIGSNLVGDSYLEQTEQDGFYSFLADPQTGTIREGDFLVFAPDDEQGFPASAGEDGIFFTADDPAVALPAGYTHVTLTRDGQVSFDRSQEVSMDILEAAADESPDFSEQSILESYHSLINLLAERYSYTELRGLDWEQIRQTYLPQVEAADEAEDFAAYFTALKELTLSIRDAHVYVYSSDFSLEADYDEQMSEAFGGTLGAQAVELSDGRFVVIYLDPESPAAEAGWEVGTEIISIDGVPVAQHIDALPITEYAGNPDIIRLNQAKLALSFPVGTEKTIEYRQPGEDGLNIVTLTAAADVGLFVPEPPIAEEEISYQLLDDGTYYIQWHEFNDGLYKVQIWEKFLSKAQGAPGIIIDLRHNGGGSAILFFTLASYLFTPEEPAQMHWTDSFTYDDEAGDLVREFASDYLFSSPNPDLTYTGPVVVLVGEGSASAAEYFPQFLQSQGRALIVGEHGTEGAGGVIGAVLLPGGINLSFTRGRSYFAGTDELNLEAKGVTLDERVPITLENEIAKQEGIDVVLQAGKEAVAGAVAGKFVEGLPGTTWTPISLQTTNEDGEIENISFENPESYTMTFGDDNTVAIQADCNQIIADYQIDTSGTLVITPGASTLALCTDDGLGEDFVMSLDNLTTFQAFGKTLILSDGIPAESTTMVLTLQEPTPEPTTATASSASGSSAELANMLGNMTYSGVLPDETITLLDGSASYDDENTGTPVVSLVDHLFATGDLDGDGVEDAAGFVIDNTTGSADFVYLVAVLGLQTDASPVGAVLIGDRTPVKSLTIEDGQVFGDFITLGPEDVLCCPTLKVRKAFTVENGRLTETSSEEMGTASLADLNGTSWQLVDLNLDQEPVPVGTEITLSIDDGEIGGFAGCNNYDSAITAGEDELPQSLTMGPIAATQKLCAEAENDQEMRYLERLAQIVAWRYDFGHLALTYKAEDGEFGELRFAPQES